jgi:hypothetical protein
MITQLGLPFKGEEKNVDQFSYCSDKEAEQD